MTSTAPWDDAKAILTAGLPTTPLQWPNLDWTNPEPPAIWVAVRMTGFTSAPIELTGGAWQEEGQLYCTIFTPAGQGSDAARLLAKTIANLFRNLGPRNVVYYAASLGEGHVADPQGAWWALDVSISWRYQDFSQ